MKPSSVTRFGENTPSKIHIHAERKNDRKRKREKGIERVRLSNDIHIFKQAFNEFLDFCIHNLMKAIT